MYFLSIRSVLKDELTEKDYKMKIVNDQNIDVEAKFHWFDKLLFMFTSVLRVLYECIYFYMFPMLIYVFIEWE